MRLYIDLNDVIVDFDAYLQTTVISEEFISVVVGDEQGDVVEVWISPQEAVRFAEALLKKARKAQEIELE